jgi:hypothetical protein
MRSVLRLAFYIGRWRRQSIATAEAQAKRIVALVRQGFGAVVAGLSTAIGSFNKPPARQPALPYHSHSTILSHRNVLNYKGAVLLRTTKTRASSRQNSSLLISKEISRYLDSARF